MPLVLVFLLVDPEERLLVGVVRERRDGQSLVRPARGDYVADDRDVACRALWRKV